MTYSDPHSPGQPFDFSDCVEGTGFFIRWCEKCNSAHVFVVDGPRVDVPHVITVFTIEPDWFDDIINDLQNLKAIHETGARKQ